MKDKKANRYRVRIAMNEFGSNFIIVDGETGQFIYKNTSDVIVKGDFKDLHNKAEELLIDLGKSEDD